MRPRLDSSGIQQSRPQDYIIRFAFGGVVSVVAGLVAKIWGPVIGGLFLAFPAILPATLTLVKKHGGRRQAVEDARGGTLGSIGLIAFAALVWGTARAWPPAAALAAATASWMLVNGLLWSIRYGR